jgi:hypothetical protein
MGNKHSRHTANKGLSAREQGLGIFDLDRLQQHYYTDKHNQSATDKLVEYLAGLKDGSQPKEKIIDSFIDDDTADIYGWHTKLDWYPYNPIQLIIRLNSAELTKKYMEKFFLGQAEHRLLRGSHRKSLALSYPFQSFRESILHMAVRFGAYETLKVILTHPHGFYLADTLRCKNLAKESPLLLAIARLDVRALKLLLTVRGHDIDQIKEILINGSCYYYVRGFKCEPEWHSYLLRADSTHYPPKGFPDNPLWATWKKIASLLFEHLSMKDQEECILKNANLESVLLPKTRKKFSDTILNAASPVFKEEKINIEKSSLSQHMALQP